MDMSKDAVRGSTAAVAPTTAALFITPVERKVVDSALSSRIRTDIEIIHYPHLLPPEIPHTKAYKNEDVGDVAEAKMAAIRAEAQLYLDAQTMPTLVNREILRNHQPEFEAAFADNLQEGKARKAEVHAIVDETIARIIANRDIPHSFERGLGAKRLVDAGNHVQIYDGPNNTDMVHRKAVPPRGTYSEEALPVEADRFVMER